MDSKSSMLFRIDYGNINLPNQPEPPDPYFQFVIPFLNLTLCSPQPDFFIIRMDRIEQECQLRG